MNYCILLFFFLCYDDHRYLHVLTHSFPTRRSSDLPDFLAALFIGAGIGDVHWPVITLGQRLADAAFFELFVSNLHVFKRVFEDDAYRGFARSEEHTSELQSLMRISYAVLCLKKKNNNYKLKTTHTNP